MADTRRLIGIDLAWGKKDGGEPARSGCAELKWENGALTLSRPIELLGRVGEIIKWIGPDSRDWVAAVDAPLVITNQDKQRTADNQVGRLYGNRGFSAHSANLTNSKFGPYYQGRMILERLRELGGTLVEKADDIDGGPLFFETYPHPVIVELFDLDQTIRYKKGHVPERRIGQQVLANHIRKHLCSTKANPQLRRDDELVHLLREPETELKGKALKGREDKLDALLCAYTAAWLDAGRPLQGLGEVGHGMIVTPALHGIGPALS